MYLGIIIFLATIWGWIAVEMYRAKPLNEDEETVG
jgi:hypothetical protein